MSSRILAGEMAKAAAPMVWRPVSPAPARTEPAQAPSASAASEEAAALQARLSRLEAEIAARETQARKAGFEEGQAAARRSLEAPYREALGRAAQAVAELASLRQRLRRETEEDLVRLAVAIARRILRREISTDPEAILGLVKAAFDRIDAREVIRLRAHPEDARTLEASFADLGLPERIEVIADKKLERGALLIETERGELDASVETQLEEIERGFADLIRRQP
jgi:flagellar assembly protein FliH